jgi:hypothetical protein
MDERGSDARPAVPVWSGIVLVALVAVVAVASHAHRLGAGSAAARAQAPSFLVQYAAAIAVLTVPLGAVLVMFALAYRRRQVLAERKATKRRTVAAIALFAVVLTTLMLVLPRIKRHAVERAEALPLKAPQVQRARRKSSPAPLLGPARSASWLPLVAGGGLLAAFAVVATLVIAAERRRTLDADEDAVPATAAGALAGVLDDALDDLRSERDPRRAVIRAYARMEATFAAFGLAREPAEAPHEYLGRVLESVHASAYSARRLTLLFERAKFSEHVIAGEMKAEAIDALVALQEELRAVRS